MFRRLNDEVGKKYRNKESRNNSRDVGYTLLFLLYILVKLFCITMHPYFTLQTLDSFVLSGLVHFLLEFALDQKS